METREHGIHTTRTCRGGAPEGAAADRPHRDRGGASAGRASALSSDDGAAAPGRREAGRLRHRRHPAGADRDGRGHAGRAPDAGPNPPLAVRRAGAGADDRPLHLPQGARPRRDGRRVHGLRPQARPQGGDQADALARLGERREPGPDPARGPGDGAAVPPQRRPGLRGGRAARRALRGDGVHRRRRPLGLAGGEASQLARGPARVPRGRSGPGGRPRGRAGAPRLQAGQRVRRRGRAGDRRRLRARAGQRGARARGPGGRPRRPGLRLQPRHPAHRDRRAARDPGLHGARDLRAQHQRRGVGSILVLRRAVRGAARQPTLRRSRRRHARARRPARGADDPGGRRGPGLAAAGRPPRPAQAARRALAVDAGAARGARLRPRGAGPRAASRRPRGVAGERIGAGLRLAGGRGPRARRAGGDGEAGGRGGPRRGLRRAARGRGAQRGGGVAGPRRAAAGGAAPLRQPRRDRTRRRPDLVRRAAARGRGARAAARLAALGRGGARAADRAGRAARLDDRRVHAGRRACGDPQRLRVGERVADRRHRRAGDIRRACGRDDR